MKLSRIVVLLAVLASMQAVGPVAHAGLPSSYCADGAATPCIVSATRNGADVFFTDPTYTVWTNPISPSASR